MIMELRFLSTLVNVHEYMSLYVDILSMGKSFCGVKLFFSGKFISIIRFMVYLCFFYKYVFFFNLLDMNV